jgi:DNA-binding transcriptional LysR family regulator
MQRRHEAQNIPIELLRSFVVIQESGSFTKAAETLHLTQPAISAQVKRLQQIVGGEVFVRSGFGVSLTAKGEIVSRYARRILAMNDQILSLAGTASVARTVRIGVPNVFASSTLATLIATLRELAKGERLQFSCDTSAGLARNVASGFLDVVFVSRGSVASAVQVAQWQEKICWVCAPDLITSPGAPVPLQSWPHGISDRLAIEVLENAGLSYSVVFAASDLSAHLAALRCGLGFAVLPQRVVPSDLRVAHEHFLPALPPLELGIYINEERNSPQLRDLAAGMAKALRPDPA